MSHEAVLFVDNSLLIRVARLVSDPERGLDAYALLDLETFCEAFLFFDRLVVLRGQSARKLEISLSLRESERIRIWLSEMKDAGILSTQDSRNYGHIWDEEILHLKRHIGEVGNNEYQEQVVESSILANDEIPTDPFARTYLYTLASMYEGKPYYETSSRTHIAEAIAERMNHKGDEIIKKCMQEVGRGLRRKVEELRQAFPDVDYSLVLPPLLKEVLEECVSADVIPEKLLQLRNRDDIKRLRKWHRDFQDHQAAGNIDLAWKDLQYIKELGRESDSTTQNAITILKPLIPAVVKPVNSLVDFAKTNVELFLEWMWRRHFVFLRRLSNSSQIITENRRLVRRVFGKDLSASDVKMLQILGTSR